MWYPEIEVSIGRSLKKAKGEEKKKLCMAFWGKAHKRFFGGVAGFARLLSSRVV